MSVETAVAVFDCEVSCRHEDQQDDHALEDPLDIEFMSLVLKHSRF